MSWKRIHIAIEGIEGGPYTVNTNKTEKDTSGELVTRTKQEIVKDFRLEFIKDEPSQN